MGSLQCEEAVIHLTVARKDVPSKVSGWRGMRVELLSQSVGRNARHPLSTSSRIPTITSSLTVAEFVSKLSGVIGVPAVLFSSLFLCVLRCPLVSCFRAIFPAVCGSGTGQLAQSSRHTPCAVVCG